MTHAELIEHILSRSAAGAADFSADEVREWPDAAHAALTAAGLLTPMPPARVIECDGCERNCIKPVHVRDRTDGQSALAFITCDEPEDYGRISVELSRLTQWHLREKVTAAALALALECPVPTDLAQGMPRHSSRDEAIKAKYAELAGSGTRNYVKEIKRTVPGAALLSDRRIRDIVKGR